MRVAINKKHTRSAANKLEHARMAWSQKQFDVERAFQGYRGYKNRTEWSRSKPNWREFLATFSPSGINI